MDFPHDNSKLNSIIMEFQGFFVQYKQSRLNADRKLFQYLLL